MCSKDSEFSFYALGSYEGGKMSSYMGCVVGVEVKRYGKSGADLCFISIIMFERHPVMAF